MRVPKHKILSFVRSETDPKTYHLTGSRFKRFVCLKVEEAYTPKIREMGVKYVINGYDQKGNKTFFSGLFPIGNGIYHADHYTPQNAKKRHLIIIKVENNILRLFYFSSYPRTSKNAF